MTQRPDVTGVVDVPLHARLTGAGNDVECVRLQRNDHRKHDGRDDCRELEHGRRDGVGIPTPGEVLYPRYEALIDARMRRF